jgi:hypothetical protein
MILSDSELVAVVILWKFTLLYPQILRPLFLLILIVFEHEGGSIGEPKVIVVSPSVHLFGSKDA